MAKEMRSPQSNPGLPSAPRTEQRETPAEVWVSLVDGSIHTEQDSSVTEISSVADPNLFIKTEELRGWESWAELAAEPNEKETSRPADSGVGAGSYENTKAVREATFTVADLSKEREASTRGSRNRNAIPDNKRV